MASKQKEESGFGDEALNNKPAMGDQQVLIEQEKRKDFMGGTIVYRPARDWDIDGKVIHTDYSFIVMADGRKMNLPLPALEAIAWVVDNDDELKTFVKKMPERVNIQRRSIS